MQLIKLTSLILTLFIVQSCKCQKTMANTHIYFQHEKQTTETYAFKYSAISRGVYKQIEINKKNITVINTRGNTPIIKSCSKTNWESIIKAIKTIDIKNISNLKAPSEKRFYDGAAIANLTIIYNGKTYKTESFDHGNPPKEIAELVKEILSISENIE
jgi:hypothetical protein